MHFCFDVMQRTFEKYDDNNPHLGSILKLECGVKSHVSSYVFCKGNNDFIDSQKFSASFDHYYTAYQNKQNKLLCT